MKLSSRKRGSSRPELSMTSMIDVIFLLLIFFMVNTSIHITERQIETNVQSQDSRPSKPRPNLEVAVIEVVRRTEGSGYEYKMGTRRIADDRELRLVLEKFPNKEDGAFVRANDDAPFALAAAALQASRDVGFKSVAYIPGSKGS